MAEKNITLYYVHDPMCSWCWGFAPVLGELLDALPKAVCVQRLLGGLAPDNESPMPEAMKQLLQQTWRQIEETIPTAKFNFGFWQQCQPRRSTYPACRAVIAARQQGQQFDEVMTTAIQEAYYRQARNPSDEDTLVSLAEALKLDVNQFQMALNSTQTEQQLQQEIRQSRELFIESFPGFSINCAQAHSQIKINYNNVQPMLEQINRFIEKYGHH